MSTQLQLRRGSTAQHASFTGESGEITVDTTKKTAVVHDGSTAGGTPLATEVALAAAALEASGAIQKSIINAKGDLLAGTADNTVGLRAVGADGDVLMADPSQASGLNYGGRGGLMSFSTAGGTIPDGATRYLGPAFFSASETDVYWRVPFAGTAKNLFTQTPGASAGTRTYTIRKNSVDQALTCAASSGAMQSSDITHSFNFNAGDIITCKVVTSGGSDVVGHTATIELIKTGT